MRSTFKAYWRTRLFLRCDKNCPSVSHLEARALSAISAEIQSDG